MSVGPTHRRWDEPLSGDGLQRLRSASVGVVDQSICVYNAGSSAAFELMSLEMAASDPGRPPPATPTIDVTSVLRAPVSSASDEHRKVHLVQGSSQGLTGEVCSVLRSRLRIASILLAIGLASFLLWGLLFADFSDPAHLVVHGLHWVVTVSCAYAGFALCRRCSYSHFKLRLFEYAIFGMVSVFLVVVQYVDMLEAARQQYLPRNMGPWHLLVFTYALLIPNTWRRALPLLSIFTLIPLVVGAVVLGVDENARHVVVAEPSVVVEFLLSALIMFGVALVGVHSINQLRTEAYEARQIGQYRLKQLLGSGGMGEVYLAEHRMMKRPCAIKVIRADKTGDPLTLARFEREVRATAKLSHWNTIDIYDYGRTDDGTFFYVMEYLPGMNLNELVRKFGSMPAERVVYLMRQACDALTEAHKLDLLHRDIKPANIFAAVRGGHYDVVKLLDFGLAKPMHSLEGSGITQEGSITGSPLFMSPEQATGDREPDVRSDIYSLGAVMYFMLTGRPPFDYERPLKVIVAHSHEMPQSISELVDGVPDDMQQIVMRCLEKNPDDRFQDAEHLAMALESSSAARGWSRSVASVWWTERCNGNVCYFEPPIAGADLSMTHDSVGVTRA